MRISAIGGDKLRELRKVAQAGMLPRRDRKERSDLGSGVVGEFTTAMNHLLDMVGESMPHLSTTNPQAGKHISDNNLFMLYFTLIIQQCKLKVRTQMYALQLSSPMVCSTPR
jgi:hypothetical protein